MKQIILVLAVIAGVFTSSIASAQGRMPGGDHRERRDNRKIRHGIHGGQITRPEAMVLRMKQAELHGMQKMAMADGRISRRERRLLRKEEHRLDKLTAYTMHNGRNRRDHAFDNGGDRRGRGLGRMDRPEPDNNPPGYFN